MKNQRSKTNGARGRRILSWLVLIGIFVCGIMAGAFIWQKHVYTANSGVQSNLVGYHNYVQPCAMREEALLAMVYKIQGADVNQAVYFHRENAKIYKKLASVGCDENKSRYAELASSEGDVADALKDLSGYNDYYAGNYDNDELNDEPCAVIEKTLRGRIKTDCPDSWCYLNNAEIYSKLAEDGCAEHKDAYTKLALDELQIAEGVRIDDTNVDRNDIRTTVNTYKKLQMQNEAKKYIKKVEKLVNPGVEFILELQRIIEE